MATQGTLILSQMSQTRLNVVDDSLLWSDNLENNFSKHLTGLTCVAKTALPFIQKNFNLDETVTFFGFETAIVSNHVINLLKPSQGSQQQTTSMTLDPGSALSIRCYLQLIPLRNYIQPFIPTLTTIQYPFCLE